MRICYFTLTTNTPPRDLAYLKGLTAQGMEIIECRDFTPGIKKFWRLWQQHRQLKNNYDIMLVGFASHILVPFARLISSRPIIFNALGTVYDGIIGSRKKYGLLGWRVIYCWLTDWLAFNSAQLTLLDTNARVDYIANKFFIPRSKLVRLWTGVDDGVFKYDPAIKKVGTFTVLFRGALMLEAGIEHLVQVADILKSQPIRFRIIGNGYGAPLLAQSIKELSLDNIEWIPERLPWGDLVHKMQECHLSLGQLSDHKRQEFHVPFKTLESMALKIPYLITANSYGILEFLTENETCFCCPPANGKALAEKILLLKDRPDELVQVAENAYQLFQSQFTSQLLSQQLLKIMQQFI